MERRIALILAGLLYLSAALFVVDVKLFDGKMVVVAHSAPVKAR
jgi:hypothetical protein